MAIDPKQLRAAFLEAVQAAPADRSGILDRLCAADAELRQRVELLLRAHDDSGDLPPVAPPTGVTGEFTPEPYANAHPYKFIDNHPKAEPGVVIAGRYTLVEIIGEGGMGEVWVAKETEPVKRRVALKLIKAGMDTKAVLQRFEAERQALALMDHPNIARVLDGGMTADRRPFFVMELVNGLALTKFCDEAKLTPRQRLELFVPICQAVQHAHQNGIVHRDLKPANILVTLIDGKPLPKVIDFGVAKAIAGRLTDESMSTQFGAVVGTLEYMSPEQAGFSGSDVDTRADIYSLGVILYELLTGLRPIDAKRLKKVALTEMVRMIQEEVPSKPSTRLSTDEALPSLAALRQTEPRKLMALLRGELDWVVMKCLEKRRERRYETANGLARDIQRYLADEAVEARPPSAGYRLSKFLSRNKGPVIATTLVVFGLLVGMAGTTWGLIEAKQQEKIARDEAELKEVAAAAENAANEQAQRRLAQIEKANDILGSIFENLDPKEIAKADLPLQVILAEKLDQAVAQLEGESIGDPLVVAAMQDKFGRSLTNLGESGKAIVVLEKSRATRQSRLGLDNVSALVSMGHLALAYQANGKLDLALPLFEETLTRQKSVLGPQDPTTFVAMNNLALGYKDVGKLNDALRLFEETLKLQKERLGPDHRDTLRTMSNFAQTFQAAGKRDLALPLFEETLKLQKAKLGPDDPDTLISMNNLALGYKAAGQLDVALPLYEEALRLQKAKLGPNHSDTLSTMNNLALAYQDDGRWDLSLPLFEETLKREKAKLGADHPYTLITMNNLAQAYQHAGKLNLALPLLVEARKLQKDKLGADHPDTLSTMMKLANAYQATGKWDLAVPLFEETLKVQKPKLGPDHPSTLITMLSLGDAYQAAGNLDLALPLLEETLKLMRSKLGPDHPATLTCMNDLAGAYRATGKLDRALALLEEALKRKKAKLGPDHPDTLIPMTNLATTYLAAGRRDLAMPLFEETLKLQTAKFGRDHPATLNTMGHLAGAYRQEKQLDKSILLFEETLRLQEAKLGRDHPNTPMTVGNLGVTYKDVGRFVVALPLLEEAYRVAPKNVALRAFGPHLVEGYLRVGKTEQATALVNTMLAEARKTLPKEGAQLAGELASIGLSLLQANAFAEAEPLIRECLAIREKNEPNDWRTFNTKSMLGGALLGQKRHAEAEPLLLAGYEGMKKREAKIPAEGKVRILDAINRLTQLYDATDKKDEADKWRKELDAIKAAQK